MEEEERQSVRDKCDERQWQDVQFEQFLDYKRKNIRHNHSRHLLIPFLDTLFPLYVHSHHGLSKIIHTPKLHTHPRDSLLSYVLT